MPTDKIVILGKTRAGIMTCVGALSLDKGTAMRLKRSDFPYWKSHDFDVGQCYELTYGWSPNKKDPHHKEDVIVLKRKYIRDMTIEKITNGLRKKNMVVKSDDPRDVFKFDGEKQPFEHNSTTGKFFAIKSEASRLLNSVGFWEYPNDLRFSNKCYHGYGFNIKYVGCQQPPIEVITSGTIVRLSTSSLWTNEEFPEPRSYLQVSGWYL